MRLARSIGPLVFAMLTVAPLARGGVDIAFRSPDGSVYCQFVDDRSHPPGVAWSAFRCFRPSDGRYAQVEGPDLSSIDEARVVAGTDPSLVGFSDPSASVMAWGHTWMSSDAELIRCVARRTGVRCWYWYGGAFVLGTTHGERLTQPPRRHRMSP